MGTPHDETSTTDGLWRLLTEEMAKRVAEHLAPRVAELLLEHPVQASPWLTTPQAIAYTGLPAGTFRKLAACGKIPCHGGRTKIFYRPELDDALLRSTGLADEARQLRSVR